MDRDTSEIGKLTERIAKDPRSKLFVPLAEEYKKIGDIEMSIHVLTEGLKNNPGYVTARSFLGRLLIDKGDLSGAQKEFEEVIKAIPDNLLGQKKLGDIYALQGRAKDALACYRAVINLNPKDQETLGLIDDLESGRDITGKISRPKVPQTAAQAPQLEQQPTPPPARQAAPSVASAPEPRAKTTASPQVSPPFQEQEEAEEVLAVEPLEAEPVSALQEPVAAGFDFLSEGKMDAGEGTIPGLEVSVPGGFFEDAPVLAPEQEGPAEAEEVSAPEGGEPGPPVFPEEESPSAAIKKSDDFTTDTLAELYISQGFYEKAIDIYDRMLAENPGHQGLRDKLARLHVLAEEAGGGQAGAENPETESALALEQGNAPDLAGIPDTGGAEEITVVPPATDELEETLPVDTAFDIGEPFGQTPFTAGEPEAKEYVPPQEEQGEQEEPPPFSGGFDLSEKAFSPSREEAENEADRPPLPAGGGGRLSPALSEAQPVEYTPAVEYTPDLPEERTPVAPSSGEPSARTVKDARKETISRLELWLKTIAKEK